MERNVYLTAIEPGSGKSAVALGVMEALASLGRVGYFRPIVAGGEQPDNDIELIRRRYRLPQTYEESFGAVVDDLRAMSDRGQYEQLLKRILEAYRRLDDTTDLMLVEGSDFSEASRALEFDFNADVANHLGCPVLLVVRGSDRTVARVLEVVQLAHGSLTGRGCTILATICNRVSPELVDELRDRVQEVVGDEPAYVLPEVPELAAPTVAEVAHALAAEYLRPVRGAEEPSTRREVGHVIVGAMSLPHFLEHISDGDMIITPGDRADLIVGSLASRFSGTYPNIAGLVLTGGLVPEPSVLRLIDGLGGSEVPGAGHRGRHLPDGRHRGRGAGGAHPRERAQDRRRPAPVRGARRPPELLGRLEVTRTDGHADDVRARSWSSGPRSDRQHIVLPEGDDDRILQAAEQLLLRGVVDLTILGDPDAIEHRAAAARPGPGRRPDHRPARLASARRTSPTTYFELRKPQGRGPVDVAYDLVADVSYFGTMMVRKGLADGMVSGAAHTTAAHDPAGLRDHQDRRPGVSIVSSVFFMCLADRVLVYGDCAVNPDPNAAQLADIAISSAGTAGAVRHRAAGRDALLLDRRSRARARTSRRCAQATAIARERRPDLPIEGPIQYDAAVDAVGRRSPSCPDQPGRRPGDRVHLPRPQHRQQHLQGGAALGRRGRRSARSCRGCACRSTTCPGARWSRTSSTPSRSPRSRPSR